MNHPEFAKLVALAYAKITKDAERRAMSEWVAQWFGNPVHYPWGRRDEALCGVRTDQFAKKPADVTCPPCKLRVKDIYETPSFALTPLAIQEVAPPPSKCLRCNYTWTSRKYQFPMTPSICPKCKSKHWMTKKTKRNLEPRRTV